MTQSLAVSLTPAQPVIIRGARVATPRGGLKEAAVVLQYGKIVDIEKNADSLDLFRKYAGANVVDAPAGSILTPGLIDQHTHGGYGVNFNLSTVDDMVGLLEQLPRKGITRLVPTVMTGTTQELSQALRNLEVLKTFTAANPEMVQIEGIHLEGPFISPAKRGAHDETLVKAANEQRMALLEKLLAVAPDIKLVTMAPELDPDGEMIRFLKDRGIRVNIGHTAATAEEAARAFDQGATGVTHSFNAMEPIHHRKPGLIPVATGNKNVYPEIIADGHHVNPSVVGMFLNSTSNGILVSDGMGLAGSEEGAEGELGGQKVFNKGGAAVNEEGNLAGSTVFVTDCVRNVANWGIKTFAQAVNLASKNPADFLGIGDRLGKIKKGYTADLVLWNPATQEVLSTWINGYRAYNAAKPAALRPERFERAG